MWKKKFFDKQISLGRTIDPNKIRVGDVVLTASGTKMTIRIQQRLGYGESSRWTHVAGSIGGYDLVEGQIPKSRVCNLQKNYVKKGIEIRVMRKKDLNNKDRVKVALWWATMNNVPYDFPQLFNFPVAALLGKAWLHTYNKFNSKKKLICSELIISGFLKEGYNLFNKPPGNVLPADFDNPNIFDVVNDIWVEKEK